MNISFVKERKVDDYIESIRGNLFNFKIKEDRIKNFIENLKDNKACGFDKVCNEFFKYGNCENLKRILKSLFECLISCGFIP